MDATLRDEVAKLSFAAAPGALVVEMEYPHVAPWFPRFSCTLMIPSRLY